MLDLVFPIAGQAVEHEGKREVGMIMVRVWLPSMFPAIRQISLLVGTVNDQAPAGLDDPEPLSQDSTRIFEVFKHVRRVNVIERVVLKPTEIPSIAAKLNETFSNHRVWRREIDDDCCADNRVSACTDIDTVTLTIRGKSFAALAGFRTPPA